MKALAPSIKTEYLDALERVVQHLYGDGEWEKADTLRPVIEWIEEEA